MVRPGLGRADLLARFEAESQVIARLDHPNIAKLIEVGVDKNGFPFIAMDLVDGPPITEYARLHQLDIPQRLRLFIQACRGVQHAHNRGILHRDLKPSNILVADLDGEPVARVIDFGLAKLLEPDDAGRRTLHGQILGTIAYTSLEQADPMMPDADVRSDVYSLGVVLYELLAGRNPARDIDLAGKSNAQVHQLLKTRRLDPPTANTSYVSRDIDCITLKALEAAPDVRYVSAGALADDVERYLQGEPVIARPPSRRRLLVRAMRRNKALTAAAAIALLALLLGVLGLSVGLWQADAARAKAVAAREAATQQKERAERAARVFDEVNLTLRRLVLTPRRGVNASYLDILRRGADDFLASPPDSVPVRARVAFSLGQALHQAGERPLARRLLTQAIQDLQSSEFDRDNAPMRDSMLFTSYTMLAGIERSSGSDEQAEHLWSNALDLGRTLEGVSPSEIMAASASFADVLAARGDLERAERVVLEARRNAEARNATPRFLAMLDGVLAGVYGRMQRYDDAARLGAAAFELRTEGRDNSSAFTIMLGLKHGRTLLYAGRDQDAKDVLENVQTLALRVLGPGHADTLAAQQLLLLARAKLGQAPPDAAPAAAALVLEISEGDEPSGVRVWRSKTTTIEILIALGQLDDARSATQSLESELAAARGPQSRDLALVRWDLGRAFAPVDPATSYDLLTHAWQVYAHDLGEAALVSRLIAKDLAAGASPAGHPDQAPHWRERAAQ